MALREKFGRLVLLEQTEISGLGREFRAARLGPAGLDRLVDVTCFGPAVSAHATATKRLMDEARVAARLQNPGLVRVLGIGRVEQTFYVSTELVEGRTLAAILERCARDSFPLAADHALMIASRVASALEYLHAKKDDAGKALFHGLLSTPRVTIAFDGEVKVKGLGLWPALHDTDLLGPAERARLAPEQAESGAGEPRSDVFALGLLLLEALTGQQPPARDPIAALGEARVSSVSGESSPLPQALADLLRRALARDPAARFPNAAEMRKTIDTLLFSGDFTPTTFDLAFFMHTLFREEMESESRAVEEARKADYREFIEDRSSGPVPVPSASTPETSAARPPAVEPPPTPALSPAPAASLHQAAPPEEAAAARRPAEVVASSRAESPHLTAAEPAVSDGHVAEPASVRDGTGKHSREVAAGGRVGASVAAAQPRSGQVMWLGLGLVVLVVAGGGGWWYFSRARAARTTTPSTTLSPEAQAALARVRDLEARIAQLERDKTEAEAKAVEDARKKLEAQAAARGRAVDPAALQKAQEDARQRARAEQEKKQQEELARIAAARKTEEKKIAEASPSPPAGAPESAPMATPMAEAQGAATPPAAVPVAFATPAAAIPSSIATPAAGAPPAQVQEAKISPPVPISQTPPRYPPLAEMRRIEGTVELTALVDETGRVVEVRVVRAVPAKLGFEEAATEHARSRRYKPATRDGTPIRMVVPIVVTFRPR